jgi:hypothetical protein
MIFTTQALFLSCGTAIRARDLSYCLSLSSPDEASGIRKSILIPQLVNCQLSVLFLIFLLTYCRCAVSSESCCITGSIYLVSQSAVLCPVNRRYRLFSPFLFNYRCVLYLCDLEVSRAWSLLSSLASPKAKIAVTQ